MNAGRFPRAIGVGMERDAGGWRGGRCSVLKSGVVGRGVVGGWRVAHVRHEIIGVGHQLTAIVRLPSSSGL